jgi:hypothetical protein
MIGSDQAGLSNDHLVVVPFRIVMRWVVKSVVRSGWILSEFSSP